ncbi:hypothetical protein RQP54_17915 [Curvibacter sp. APW13]|uniref:hypothetical protein n=1 Tax=Curvibacter sp. APW13 TaxID=3077236 RepID=UPI0028DF8DDA|nr:hypothetical protein [Curvibacter sp. APW13]MDT8992754.1 hypothetical protein [Curvibacter sp. APW13]
MKTYIIFMPEQDRPGTEHYFRNYEKPEAYGIEVRHLTPRHDKHGYGFSVRSQGKRYRGYISGQGDCIVRLGRQPVRRGGAHV